MGQPYIPLGTIPLLSAIEVVARATDPEATSATMPDSVSPAQNALRVARGRRASVSISEASNRSGNPSTLGHRPDAETAERQIKEWEEQIAAWDAIVKRQRQALASAGPRVLQALGNGELRATIIFPFGELVEIPANPWRTREGNEAISKGTLEYRWNFLTPPVRCPVFLREVALQAWLHPAPVGSHTVADERRLLAWLTEQMRGAPFSPRSKHEMTMRAEEEGLKTSKRGFDRAWAAAVTVSDARTWSHPGRKRKSTQ